MSESHELLGIRNDHRPYPDSDKMRRDAFYKLFILISIALVVLPMILSIILYRDIWENGTWGDIGGIVILAIPMTYYFFPPYLIFGTTFFDAYMFVIPNSLASLLITAVFYENISLALTLLIIKLRKNK